jgi:hypothetical protein
MGISTRPTFDLHEFFMRETDGRSVSTAYVGRYGKRIKWPVTWGQKISALAFTAAW